MGIYFLCTGVQDLWKRTAWAKLHFHHGEKLTNKPFTQIKAFTYLSHQKVCNFLALVFIIRSSILAVFFAIDQFIHIIVNADIFLFSWLTYNIFPIYKFCTHDLIEILNSLIGIIKCITYIHCWDVAPTL